MKYDLNYIKQEANEYLQSYPLGGEVAHIKQVGKHVFILADIPYHYDGCNGPATTRRHLLRCCIDMHPRLFKLWINNFEDKVDIRWDKEMKELAERVAAYNEKDGSVF